MVKTEWAFVWQSMNLFVAKIIFQNSNKNILDIRTQLNEQLRCLDTRLECQQSQLLEIQVRKMKKIENN